MCGINGFNFSNKELILKMNESIRHRGPDDTGDFENKAWSLGANRLAIIDLSQAGHQPMVSEDGRHVIVMNGEIYNFEEVREELLKRGHKFFSRSDTEVALRAYREWGIDFFHKLNGMFGLAILNTETNELILARDRLGVKPIYYFHKNGVFAFSSEAKALLAHGVSPELDHDALNVYFRMLYTPSPLTMWKEIRKLPAGHYMRIQGESVEVKQYWKVEDAPLLTDRDEVRARVKELMEDAVRLQMISDRPIGVFLSGGVDSTIVTGIMSKFSKKVQTFSAGYEETPEAEKYNNDAVLARKTAAHFGTEHHELTLSAQEVADNLVQTAHYMDEPISNHVQTVNMLLARFVQKSVTVVLGGDGGDELFGGYERYYYNRLSDRLRFVPGLSLLHPLLGTPPGVTRYLSYFAQKEDLVGSFVRPAFNDPSVTPALFEKLFFADPAHDSTRQMMRTDVRSWLADESLMRSDKMSMAASIEQRVPFLDHRLVEYADRIPTAWKIGSKGFAFGHAGTGYKGKVILKEACAEYLPEFVLTVPKWGWFSPAAKWVRKELRPLMDEVLSPGYCAGTKDLFDWEALERIKAGHMDGSKYALNTLWSVMTFQLWYRQFIENRV